MADRLSDVQTKLTELTKLVESARSMPMSASCVVNRSEVLGLLDEVEALLPPALTQAQAVLGDQQGVVEQGHREAERIVAEAHEERCRMLQENEVFAEAKAEADRLLEQSRSMTDAMRLEVEDYVDAKLANFEIVLTKTLSAVERGRDKLSGRSEFDSLGPPDDQVDGFLEEPLPS